MPDHDLRLKAVDRLVDAFGFIPGTVEVPHAAPPPIIVTFSLHGQETSAVPGTKAVDMAPMMKPFVFKLRRAGLPNGSGNG